MSDRDLKEEHTVQRMNNVFTLSESLDMPVGKTLWYTAQSGREGRNRKNGLS